MSEFQYYEFQAVDRPLDRADREALRRISSRARITATSFTNHYDWGDLSADPGTLMERWFDLHVYVANWGTHRLMMRLPRRSLEAYDLDRFLAQVDGIGIQTSGDNMIVDIVSEQEGCDEYWDDGSGWLAALAPLRSDLLKGDLRLFYLLWLSAVEEELVPDDEVEPLPGIAPLNSALEAFAEFFRIDRDLLQSAAEAGETAIPEDNLDEALAAVTESDKTALLKRVVEGDPCVVADLKSRIDGRRPVSVEGRRTAGALRSRATQVAEERKHAEKMREEAERLRLAKEAERARRARIEVLKLRGASVWKEIEEEIDRRNAAGYDRAAQMISDLNALATEEGSERAFNRRIADIRVRHETKRKFIERLGGFGQDLP